MTTAKARDSRRGFVSTVGRLGPAWALLGLIGSANDLTHLVAAQSQVDPWTATANPYPDRILSVRDRQVRREIESIDARLPGAPPSPNATTRYEIWDPIAVDAALAGFRAAAIKAADPVLYLRMLSPLHVRWHAVRNDWTAIWGGDAALLLFHWHLVTQFEELGLVKPMNVPVLTEDHFRVLDSSAHWDPGFDVPVRSVLDLNVFCIAMEQWHSHAHMALMAKTPRDWDIMRNDINVYIWQFWALHSFINKKFVRQLLNLAPHVPELAGTNGDVAQMVKIFDRSYLDFPAAENRQVGTRIPVPNGSSQRTL